MCTCTHRHFHECLHMYEVSSEERQKKDNEIYWGRRVVTVGQGAGESPDHQSRVKEMRNEEAGTSYWSRPNGSLICPSASILRHHTASAPAFSLMLFHVRDPAPPILCLFFSHCLMALEPAMLPWEPAGDSRHPLHLFPFILFWKWIKYVLFRLAWKLCPDSRILKYVRARWLI